MADVSTATVSRALHNMPGVSEAKRREIDDIVQKIGQTPRQRARNRNATSSAESVSKKGTICLLQTYDGYLGASELFVRQLKAMTDHATVLGFDVVVAFGNDVKDLPPCIRETRAVGVLIYGGKTSEGVSTALQDFPTVWLASHSKLPHNMVMPGNEEAGQLAARHLIQTGHQHLGCVYPYEHHVMDTRLLAFSGYALAQGHTVVRYSGTDTPKNPTKPHQWYEALLKPIVEKWMATRPRPTGLFSPDDAITAHLYPILKQRGIKIGKDVAIVSFGNESSYLAGLDPRPASIDIGPDMMGKQAIDMLCRAINNPSAEERGIRVSIQPVLVEP